MRTTMNYCVNSFLILAILSQKCITDATNNLNLRPRKMHSWESSFYKFQIEYMKIV